MKKIKSIILFVITILLLSCNKEKPCCTAPGLFIYELNDTAYLNYLPVCKVGTCFPGQDFKPEPMKMHKGYYLENGGFAMFGTNTVLLDIRISDYARLDKSFNYDSLRKNVLTDNPFAELFYDSKHILGGGGSHKYWDTARLNQIIDSAELNKWFERLK